MDEVRRILKDYLDYVEIEKGNSPRTRENYERYLNAFFRATNIQKLHDLTLPMVNTFRLSLARSGLKRSSQSYYLIAVRNFLKYCAKHDFVVLSPDKIELPKLPARQIEIIDYKDLERLLSSPQGDDLRALRDRAILEVFFSTGLRLSELCALGRYINLDRGEISVRGKGEKLRLVFFSERARDAVRKYLEKRPDALECLFVSLTKNSHVIGRITPRAVERMISFYKRKAGISGRLTPHSLRHIFATDLLINGADIRSVQELLGHSNISTTQIYTHLTNKELREIHRAFHGKRR